MNALPDAAAYLPLTPALRARIEATIERLVALLDAIDGDPDLELMGDDEPSLGWTYHCDGGPNFSCSGIGDDRELEDEIDEDGGDTEWSGDELDDSWTEKCSQGADELSELPRAARVHATMATWSGAVPAT